MRGNSLGDALAVTRLLTKYSLPAGLEPITPHALGHPLAARALNANPGDRRGLARLLNHRRIATMISQSPASRVESAHGTGGGGGRTGRSVSRGQAAPRRVVSASPKVRLPAYFHVGY
ncbi:MAG TPA: hypothetical protein DEP84_05510 [Chloroflexi bacterium]|nr:hypothetical protein [Chloroflexota bacterium]